MDKVLEGLVSPAPESFHVLHYTILKISDNLHEDEIVGLNDLLALSKFLVKPKYTIKLYYESGGLKWKLVPQTTDDDIIYPIDWKRGKDELYHKLNTVQLSRMALEVATENSQKSSNLSELNELAQQAEVRCYILHDAFYALCIHISYSCHFSYAEKIKNDNGIRFTWQNISRCMLQLRSFWSTEYGQPVPTSLPCRYSRTETNWIESLLLNKEFITYDRKVCCI